MRRSTRSSRGRSLRLTLLGAVAAAPLVLVAPAAALEVPGFSDVPLPLPTLPGGIDPSTLVPTPPGGGSTPPGSPALPLPAPELPVLPPTGGLPPLALPPLAPAGDGNPIQPVLDGLAASPGAGGETQDPCSDATGPATDAGAPLGASCGITPTAEGGVDLELCLTILDLATCEAGATPPSTTPTTTGAGGSANGSGSGTAASASARFASGGTNNAAAAAGGSGSGGSTLPFTGGAVGALLALGSTLATGGGVAARVLRRRRV